MMENEMVLHLALMRRMRKISVDGGIILQCIPKIYGVRMWIGFIRQRTKASVGPLLCD
jgi:hypothetical protein